MAARATRARTAALAQHSRGRSEASVGQSGQTMLQVTGPAALKLRETMQAGHTVATAAAGPAETSSPPQTSPGVGSTRARVRELLGEPDLAVSKTENDHLVEHFVYINPVRRSATTMLLLDGRVASVYPGMPSVSLNGNGFR